MTHSVVCHSISVKKNHQLIDDAVSDKRIPVVRTEVWSVRRPHHHNVCCEVRRLVSRSAAQPSAYAYARCARV